MHAPWTRQVHIAELHFIPTSYSFPEMEASATDSFRSCILLSAIAYSVSGLQAYILFSQILALQGPRQSYNRLLDSPSPQNLLTSAVLKSPAFQPSNFDTVKISEVCASSWALLQLPCVFTLQTGLVNGDLPSFNGCDGHIKSSVCEYIIRCHELLCPASISARAIANCT